MRIFTIWWFIMLRNYLNSRTNFYRHLTPLSIWRMSGQEYQVLKKQLKNEENYRKEKINFFTQEPINRLFF